MSRETNYTLGGGITKAKFCLSMPVGSEDISSCNGLELLLHGRAVKEIWKTVLLEHAQYIDLLL